ncbi:MAG: hypothetical protein ACK4Q5_00435 [Saprospiraceae bacterium]
MLVYPRFLLPIFSLFGRTTLAISQSQGQPIPAFETGAVPTLKARVFANHSFPNMLPSGQFFGPILRVAAWFAAASLWVAAMIFGFKILLENTIR